MTHTFTFSTDAALFDMRERGEPEATFHKAYEAIGAALMGHDRELQEALLRMDTSPREFLIEALVKDDLI